MEHVIASQITNHGEENNILYPLQHGFRRGRSCETQLIEFVYDLSSDPQANQQTDVLVVDFAKAFGKVCHSLLIHKLHHNGIRGKINTRIKNWLANRKQTVVVEGEKSPLSGSNLECPKDQYWGLDSSSTISMTSLLNYIQLFVSSLTTR